jgi:hypothetical protein
MDEHMGWSCYDSREVDVITGVSLLASGDYEDSLGIEVYRRQI